MSALLLPAPLFKVSYRELGLVSFGGLRGAVSLIMSMMVVHSHGIGPHVRDRVGFWVASTVAITLFVNGCLCGVVAKALGLLDEHVCKQKLLDVAKSRLQVATAKALYDCSLMPQMQGANWDCVRAYLQLKVGAADAPDAARSADHIEMAVYPEMTPALPSSTDMGHTDMPRSDTDAATVLGWAELDHRYEEVPPSLLPPPPCPDPAICAAGRPLLSAADVVRW